MATVLTPIEIQILQAVNEGADITRIFNPSSNRFVWWYPTPHGRSRQVRLVTLRRLYQRDYLKAVKDKSGDVVKFVSSEKNLPALLS